MFAYAEPIEVENIDECRFYHSIQLPGHEPIEGDWDLQKTIDAYLGNYDFEGKRVLDVGTASGFLTFEMEKRGADVVSFDLASEGKWDIVPHFRIKSQLEDLHQRRHAGIRKIKKSYWYSHKQLKSQAKVFYGNVYDLPEELGQFNVVLFGMILSHLRDPFQALYSASRLSTDTIIVVNQTMSSKDPVANFMPSRDDASIFDSWWGFSEGCIKRMLGVLGFDIEKTITSKHVSKHRDKPENCTAFIAKRIQEAS